VVTLFNAIAKHQKTLADVEASSGKASQKQAAVVASTQSLLDMIKRGSGTGAGASAASAATDLTGGGGRTAGGAGRGKGSSWLAEDYLDKRGGAAGDDDDEEDDGDDGPDILASDSDSD
jgi:hypothetical protein